MVFSASYSVLLLTLCTAALLVYPCIAADPIDLEFGTYLFLDDHLLAQQKGLSREQHKPQKLGQVIKQEYEWETGIYFYTSFLQVSENEYRIYYTCIGMDNYRTNTINLCVANSTDGVTFQKPFLGIIPYGPDNSTKNNIVFATPLGGWPNTVWLDHNPNSVPSQKFKMTYDNADRYLRIASSEDGFHWEWLATPGIASQFADTQSVVVWDSHKKEYIAFGREDNGRGRDDSCPGNYNSYRNIVISTSTTNMTGFGKESLIYSWDDLDPVCYDPYNPAAILYPNDPYLPPYSPHVPGFLHHQEFILFPSYTFHLVNITHPFSNPYTARYGQNDNLLDIHLAYSVNGSNYAYITKEPFIPRGVGYRDLETGMFTKPGSTWDSGFVFMSRGIIQTPGNPNYLTLYYYGTQMTHTYAAYIHNANFSTVAKGLGRAQIRRDGFASLNTDYNAPMPQAALQTKPIVLPYDEQCGSVELHLNIETSVAGQVVVELLDVNNKPIAGFTQENFVPIVGNFVRIPASWYINGVYISDLTKIASTKQTISVSITLSHTKLYAFEIVCVPK